MKSTINLSNIVLFNELKNILKVVHVLANHKSGMPRLHLLIVLERIASLLNLGPGPSGIDEVTKVVLGACKHGDGHLALDVGVVDQWWLVLAVLLVIYLLRAPVKELHVPGVDHLSVVDHTLDRCASREMAHVDIKSSRIIKERVLGNEETFGKLADRWEYLACFLHDIGLPAVEQVVDVDQIQRILDCFCTL